MAAGPSLSLNGLITLPDQSLVVTGTFLSLSQPNGKRLPFMAKFDNELNLIWYQSYIKPDSTGFELFILVYLSDSTILAAGSTGFGARDIIILKMDTSGNKIWSKSYSYPNSNTETILNLFELSNGNLLSIGIYGSQRKLFSFLLSPNGDLLWVKRYDFEDAFAHFNASQIIKISTDKFLISAIDYDTVSRSLTPLFFEINNNGTVNYSYKYGSIPSWYSNVAISVFDENKVFLSSHVRDTVNSPEINSIISWWIHPPNFELDCNNSARNCYSLNDTLIQSNFTFLSHNPPITLFWKQSVNSDYTHLQDSIICKSDSIQADTSFGGITVFPVPAENEIFLEIDINDIPQLMIFDIQGRSIYKKIKSINDNKIALDISSYAKGIYFIAISSKAVNKNLKFIKY